MIRHKEPANIPGPPVDDFAWVRFDYSGPLRKERNLGWQRIEMPGMAPPSKEAE